MSSDVAVRVLTEADHPAWEAFVAASPDGSTYALPRYLEVLAAETSARVRILAAEREGRILGGIPLYERRSLAGAYVAPRLLLYYNGPVLGRTLSKYPSEQTSLSVRVLQALATGLRELGLASVCVHPRETLVDARPLLAEGWTATPSYSYILRIDDLDAAWDRVEGNYRRLVKRCDRDGFRLARDDDFDAFFALHRDTHERKGFPLYLPEAAFRRYYDRLRAAELCCLFHARDPADRVVATQLVLLGPHPICHTVCAGSHADYAKSGASVFLRWKAAEALAGDGYLGNDLTDAALNPVARLKSQLGAELCLSQVLQSPETWPFRWRRTAARALESARRRLGRVTRPPG